MLEIWVPFLNGQELLQILPIELLHIENMEMSRKKQIILSFCQIFLKTRRKQISDLIEAHL